MQCPQCQQQNPPQAKFCLECGVRLVLLCAQCGTALPAGAKFCLECGQPVDAPPTTPSRFTAPDAYTPTHLAEKILTSRSALEGERKQVTVLFADLKGSMELLAGRMEEASDRAGRALALARTYKERGSQAHALRLLGEIAAYGDLPHVEPAEDYYRQAIALAEELGMRPLLAHCHHGLGTLYLKTGRLEPARLELTIAIALYRAMEMTFWLPQAEAMLARVQ